MWACGSSKGFPENKPLAMSIYIRLLVNTKVWPFGRGGKMNGHQSLRYFHSPYSTLEGVEREVVSVFHLPHKYQVIQGHKHRPMLAYAGQPHHLSCPNSDSFFLKYGLVRGQVQLRVFLYSVCLHRRKLDLQETKTKRKSKIRKMLTKLR